MVKREYQILQQGDVVDILAPAFGIHQRDADKISDYIKSLGLIPRFPENFMQGDIIASAPEEVRFKQLKKALFAQDSKAIWCVKGGSGSPQIIPYLNEIEPPERQKLFIAFSDNTSIHFFLNQKWGWQSLHAPILWQIVRNRVNDETIQQVENIIFGRDYKNNFSLSPINKENISSGVIQAQQVMGGNLKLVQCSIGTIWEIQAKGKILLFEDINEKPYQLDRILTHILQAKLADEAAAIIFGDFEGGEIEMDMPLIEKVLERFSQQINVPVFRTSGIGHTEKNWSVHFGVPAKIEVDNSLNAELIIEKVE